MAILAITPFLMVMAVFGILIWIAVSLHNISNTLREWRNGEPSRGGYRGRGE